MRSARCLSLVFQGALQVLRSVLLALWQLTWRRPAEPTDPLPTISMPIVLIPGLMAFDGDLKETVAALRARGLNVHATRLGPVSSNHDRACELFYALKGGRVDFGAEHSAKHGHSRFGPSHADGLLPDWDAEHPIILITHSQGAGTALVLQHLLATGDFFGPQHATTAGWVQAVVSIAAPLNGAANIHDAVWGAPRPAPAKADGAAADEQFCGPWTSGVGFLVTIGYVLHVLVGWSARVRSAWDWQLDQWRLSVCDLPHLALQTHPILRSTDTALYELTPAGAAVRNARLLPHAGCYYVALPAQITHGADALPLPSAPPLYAVLAALHAAGAPIGGARQSDGVVPVESQCFPTGHPHRHVAELTAPPRPPPARAAARAARATPQRAPSPCEPSQRAQLRGRLRRGAWNYADASPVGHGSAALYVGSELFEHALRVIVPAIIEAVGEDGS